MSAHSTAIVLGTNTFIANEIPTGDVNNINKDFILTNTPVSGSVMVRLSGIVQVPGASKDYTLTAKTITFIKAPKTGQEVVVSYFTT